MEKMPNESSNKAIPDEEPVLAGREERLAREREMLEEALAISDFSTIRARVAHILNTYPASRNSDVTLQLKYWEEFEPDILKNFEPQKLYKGIRLTSLARARAKIQNEYGLFQAKDEVRQARRRREEWTQEAVLADQPACPSISIYADESGKNKRWPIIAGLWSGNGKELYSLESKTIQWLDDRGFKGRKPEFHFTKVSAKYIDLYRQWWDWVLATFPSIGFKAMILDSPKMHDSSQAIFHRLYPRYIIHGLRHEWGSGRVDTSQPCSITVVFDEEQRDKDAILRDNIRDDIIDEIRRQDLKDRVNIRRVTSDSSAHVFAIQLADLFAATVNRLINETGSGTNPKDQLANYIRKALDIHVNEDGSLSVSGDRVVIEYLD